MNVRMKFGLYSLGVLVTGFGLSTIKSGAMTEGLIEIVVGIIIILLTVSDVKKKIRR